MWLINIFILLASPTDSARVTMSSNLDYLTPKSNEIVAFDEESNDIHVNETSKDLNASPSDSKIKKHLKHGVFLNNNAPPHFLSQDIDSDRINAVYGTPKYTILDNKPPPTRDSVTIHSSISRDLTPSFLVEDFSQLNPISVPLVDTDATHSQLQIASLTSPKISGVSEDHSVNVSSKGSSQTSGLISSIIKDLSGAASDDPEVPQRTNRIQSQINTGSDYRDPPGEVTGLSAVSGGPDRINISWTAPSNTGGTNITITGYRITRTEGFEPLATTIETNYQGGTTYTDMDGLKDNTRYCYNVAAINNDPDPNNRDGAFNIEPKCTTTSKVAPDPPTSVSARAGGPSSIVISWVAPLYNGGAAITGYVINFSTTGNEGSWSTHKDDIGETTTSYTHTGLLAETRGYYTISAKNSVGTGDPSQVVFATTNAATAPGAPTSLSATAGGQTSISLTWAAPTNTGGAAITGYKIEVSPNGTSSWSNLEANTGSQTTRYTHSGLTAGTTRHYRVSAINSANLTGSASNIVSETTDAATAPGAPTSLSATAGGQTSISLTWAAPTNTGGAAITGYKIEVSPNGTSSWSNLEANTGSQTTRYTHSGLTAGTTRHYRVSAINSANLTGSASNIVSETTDAATAPGAPTSLSATAGGQTSISLTWVAPTNTGGAAITGYKIEVSPNGTSSWSNLEANTGSQTTRYTHSGLTAGTTRHYRVSAINSANLTGSASNIVSETTDAATAPGAPTSLSATAGGQTSISLTWVAPTNTGGAAITGYKIEVSPNGTSSWSNLEANTGSQTTRYTHSGLTAGTTRHYRVSAINSANLTGSASNIVSETTDATTAPGAPTSLSATAGGQTSISLTWAAPTNTGGAAITGYKIEVSPNGTSSWSNLEANTGSQTTRYTHSGLTAGTTRHYRVSAINSANLTGSASNIVSATTDAATAPGAPTSLSATAGGQTSISLTWAAPTNTGGAAITGYKIEVSPNGTSSWSNLEANTGSQTTRYTHSGLTAGTTRHYRVSAINSANLTGSASNIVSETTDAATAPGAPTSLSATAGGQTSISLTWVAPTNTGGAAITGYKIEVSPNGTSSWSNLEANTGSQTTSYTHSGLTAGTTRHYRVSAINSANLTGSASNIVSETTNAATAPGAPTSLSATAGGQTSISLTWAAPTNTGGAAITGYKIEVSPNGTSSWSNLEANTGSQTTRYTHSGLTAGTTRHYRVSAINSANLTGSASNIVSATTDALNASRPQAPTSLTASATGRTMIVLSWTAPSSNGGAAIKTYKIEVSSDGTSGWADLVENSSTTYTHTGLTPSSTRYYRVSAINSVGASDPSNVVSATTNAVSAPNPPTALTATALGSTIINLKWNAPSDDGGAQISGYKIEVSPDGTSSWTNLVANSNSTALNYSHTGLTAGVTRYYRVSAINSVATSQPSVITNATTGTATAPSAPTELSATAGGPNSIDLSWTAPLNNGGSDINAYLIEVSPNGISEWSNLVANTGSSATDYSDSGLTSGTTRYYRVSAISSGGIGSPSNVASATTSEATSPDAPSSLTANATSTTTIDLSWTAPLNNGGSAITGYRIEMSSDGAVNSWSDLVSNTSETLTTYTDNSLQPDMTRYYRVSAINSVGTSPPSNVVNATASAASSLTFSDSVSPQFYPIGLPVKGVALPMATGGVSPYVYDLAPELPSGLTFNAQTRTISGTPTEITNSKTFTLSVKDANRNQTTLQFNIVVYKISFDMPVDSSQVYVLGQLIEPLVLPGVTGGVDPVKYALTPLDSLPSGLRYNLSTRTMSGVPEQIKSPVEFTYKATDKNGAQDSLKFSIEVNSPVNTQRETGVPQELVIHTNYPNPFVQSTRLLVDLPWSAQIHIEVMDITGRRVYSMPVISMTAGWAQEIELNGLNLPSGSYLYHMTATSLESQSSSVYVGQFMSIR